MPTQALKTAPQPARRSQAQRRAATQERLIAATLQCLEDLGYAGTTTTAVAKRSGLSQGALFVHFKTKADLVAAAVADLFAGLILDFKGAVAEVAPGESDELRVAAVIAALWTVFEQPKLGMTFEIYAAARTDPGLAKTLAPIATAHRQNIAAEAQALFPIQSQQDERFFPTVELVIDAMQGAAVTEHALPGITSSGPVLERLTAIIIELVADARQADASTESVSTPHTALKNS
jgi:AcrR family transcriptional regulator